MGSLTFIVFFFFHAMEDSVVHNGHSYHFFFSWRKKFIQVWDNLMVS